MNPRIMRELFNAFRHAVRDARGPVRSAVFLSLTSVLLCSSEFATWMTGRRPPMAAIVSFDQMPVNVVCVLDMSESVSGPTITAPSRRDRRSGERAAQR